MALTVSARGNGSNNTSEASTTISPASNMAAGSCGVLILALDNANAAAINVPASITDSVGNTWYLRIGESGGITANDDTEQAWYYAHLATAFTTSDSLTITYTAANVTAKCYQFYEIVPDSGCRVLPIIENINDATTASPTITTLQVPNGYVVIGAVGAENGTAVFTGDADTTNGSWSTKQDVAVGVSTTGMALTSQYKIVTAGATQTYNPTLALSADLQIGYMIFGQADDKSRNLIGLNVSQSSVVITPSYPLAAGSMGVLVVAIDNAGSGGSTQNVPTGPITDSKGNTWTLRQTGIYDPGAASVGVEIAIYTSKITTELIPGDTITLSLGVAATNKAWAIWEFSPGANKEWTYVAGGLGTGAASGTPTVTTGSITSGDMVIGFGGSESAHTWVDDADASDGTWKKGAAYSAGTGASGMAVHTQYKVTTGTATQTFNPTLTSADQLIGYIVLHEINNYVMACTQGSYTYTGFEVTLTEGGGGGGSATIVVDQGNYALAGQAVALWKGRVPLTINTGNYVITGFGPRLQKIGDPPYPHSIVITGITFDESTLFDEGHHSDVWPGFTWASDGNLYLFWGDGEGWGGDSDVPDSMGMSRIIGSPTNFTARNIWGGIDPLYATTPIAGKVNGGFISIAGTFYIYVAEQDVWTNCNLWKSTNGGETWTDLGQLFNETNSLFAAVGIVQFGKDYAGARDTYVYGYDAGTDRASDLMMFRVPISGIESRANYEFFAGLSGSTPIWTSIIANAKPVFQDVNGVNWGTTCVYHPALQRYLLSVRNGGEAGDWGLFEGPEPWGPWATVAYGTDFPTHTYAPTIGDPHADRPSYMHGFPPNWISELTVWHICDRGDQFVMGKATLTLASGVTRPPLTVTQGAYGLTGQPATFRQGHRISLLQGSYALAGQDASLEQGYLITVAQGAYSLIGNNVGLVHGQTGEFTLVVDAGSYALTGNAANLLKSLRIALNQGGFTLTGQPINLSRGRSVALTAGAFTLTGEDVLLRFDQKLATATGNYVLDGQPAGLFAARRMAAGAGAFALNGQAAEFRKGRTIQLASGVFVLTGEDVVLIYESLLRSYLIFGGVTDKVILTLQGVSDTVIFGIEESE